MQIKIHSPESRAELRLALSVKRRQMANGCASRRLKNNSMRKILISIPIIAGARILRLLNDIAQKEKETNKGKKTEIKTEKEPIIKDSMEVFRKYSAGIPSS